MLNSFEQSFIRWPDFKIMFLSLKCACEKLSRFSLCYGFLWEKCVGFRIHVLRVCVFTVFLEIGYLVLFCELIAFVVVFLDLLYRFDCAAAK